MVLVFDNLAHHVYVLHDTTFFVVLLEDEDIIASLVGHVDIDKGLILHCVEFVLLVLNELHQVDSFRVADKDLLAEVFDCFLLLEEDSLHDGNGLTCELRVVVFGELNHSFQDG